MCKPLKQSVYFVDGDTQQMIPCSVFFELSEFENFDVIAAKSQAPIKLRSGAPEQSSDPNLNNNLVAELDNILPVTVEFSNLKSGSKYFIRCCLSTETSVATSCAAFQGRFENNFQQSSFWTLPSGDEGAQQQEHGYSAVNNISYPNMSLVCFGPLVIDQQRGITAQPIDVKNCTPMSLGNNSLSESPTLCCMLGNMISHNGSVESSTDDSRHIQRLTTALRSHPAFIGHKSALRSASVLLAWRDDARSSIKMLREEEEAHKKLRHDVKKYQKKYGDAKGANKKPPKKGASVALTPSAASSQLPPPPVPRRPALSSSLRCLLEVYN
jgi:hypothetical protein